MSKYVKQSNGTVVNTNTGRVYTADAWAKKLAKRDARAIARGEVLPPVKVTSARKAKATKPAPKATPEAVHFVPGTGPDTLAQASLAKKSSRKSPGRKPLTEAQKAAAKAQRIHERRSAAAKARWARVRDEKAAQAVVEFIDHEGNALDAAQVPAAARN